MRKFLTLIVTVMSLGSLSQAHAQLLLLSEQTEAKQLKGRVKEITMTYYNRKRPNQRMVSEYDTSGRIIFSVNYYIKNDPQKRYFSYDSMGRLTLRIYENNEYSHRYAYEYKNNSNGLIITQRELRDGEFRQEYDSVVYNNDNLPVFYILRYPHLSIQYSIQYTTGDNNEKIKYIERKDTSGIVNTAEEIVLYNEKGYFLKRVRRSVNYLAQNDTIFPYKHSEEYDYVDYKYDKQDNWTKRKIYLNWDEWGRKFYMKIKRKIEYY